LESAELVDYYRRRAAEYEAIYAKPERQSDLTHLKQIIPGRLSGAWVLEIACGTGYWTTFIAETAASIVATDLAQEPVQTAQSKAYLKMPAFMVADAYALPETLGRFDAAFAGFWWSHVPLARVEEFLASLHARLEPGARILMLDNRYADGSSTPISEIDLDGNTFQLRRLADGSAVRVLKNFPSEAELHGRLSPHAISVDVQWLEYYWLMEYRLK